MSQLSRASLLSVIVLGVGCASPQQKMEQRVATSQREGDPKLLKQKAIALAQMGDFTRAEQYLQAALQRGGDESEILPLLIEVELRDGRYRLAADHLKERLRTHPGDIRARFVLGTLQSALGNSVEAREQLERVLQEQPTHPEANFALAVLYRDAWGDYSRADSHFRRYLKLDPNGSHREEAMASTLNHVP